MLHRYSFFWTPEQDGCPPQPPSVTAVLLALGFAGASCVLRANRGPSASVRASSGTSRTKHVLLILFFHAYESPQKI